jgi:hypothetical protein
VLNACSPPLPLPPSPDTALAQVVETARGQGLADEYGIKFFETSAKSNTNVVECFTAIATDIKKRLMDKPDGPATKDGGIRITAGADQKKGTFVSADTPHPASVHPHAHEPPDRCAVLLSPVRAADGGCCK